MQEQAHYLYARLSQGAVAADLVLCMHAKGKSRFAEQRSLSLFAQKERGGGGGKAFGAFAYQGGQAFANGGQEEQKKKKAKKVRLSTYAQLCSM